MPRIYALCSCKNSDSTIAWGTQALEKDQILRNNRTSLRGNQVRQRQQLPLSVVLQTPPPHRIDVWLPRLANVTQVVLLCLTAGGFYFTVLPLYQKALLDEAYARKEFELKKVTALLEDKYGKLRQVAVRNFVFNADADCSGFTEMMRKKDYSADTKTNPFSIDVKRCLLDEEIKSNSLSELRPNDRVVFRTALIKVADEISTIQHDAEASYQRADSDINSSNIEAYASKREFTAKMLSFLVQNKMIKPDDIARQKRKEAVEELKAERVQHYRNAVTAHMRVLMKMRWPVS